MLKLYIRVSSNSSNSGAPDSVAIAEIMGNKIPIDFPTTDLNQRTRIMPSGSSGAYVVERDGEFFRTDSSYVSGRVLQWDAMDGDIITFTPDDGTDVVSYTYFNPENSLTHEANSWWDSYIENIRGTTNVDRLSVTGNLGYQTLGQGHETALLRTNEELAAGLGLDLSDIASVSSRIARDGTLVISETDTGEVIYDGVYKPGTVVGRTTRYSAKVLYAEDSVKSALLINTNLPISGTAELEYDFSVPYVNVVYVDTFYDVRNRVSISLDKSYTFATMVTNVYTVRASTSAGTTEIFTVPVTATKIDVGGYRVPKFYRDVLPLIASYAGTDGGFSSTGFSRDNVVHGDLEEIVHNTRVDAGIEGVGFTSTTTIEAPIIAPTGEVTVNSTTVFENSEVEGPKNNVMEVEPTTAKVGDLWFNPVTGNLHVYTEDL